jgi:hypothetical protein
MYEKTIEKVIEQDNILKKIFLGCLAKDEIPQAITNFPACFIMNTKPRSNRGEHWLAIYYNNSGQGYFFDSYGMPPNFYKLDKYMQSTSKEGKYVYNPKRLQGVSNLCGLYCILFLYFKARNRLDDFFSKFSTNLHTNDSYILNKLLKYSNKT